MPGPTLLQLLMQLHGKWVSGVSVRVRVRMSVRVRVRVSVRVGVRVSVRVR